MCLLGGRGGEYQEMRVRVGKQALICTLRLDHGFCRFESINQPMGFDPDPDACPSQNPRPLHLETEQDVFIIIDQSVLFKCGTVMAGHAK